MKFGVRVNTGTRGYHSSHNLHSGPDSRSLQGVFVHQRSAIRLWEPTNQPIRESIRSRDQDHYVRSVIDEERRAVPPLFSSPFKIWGLSAGSHGAMETLYYRHLLFLQRKEAEVDDLIIDHEGRACDPGLFDTQFLSQTDAGKNAEIEVA